MGTSPFATTARSSLSASWVPVTPGCRYSASPVTDVTPSPELFDELNSINRDIGFARAFFVNSQVLIESEIWADDVNPGNFQHACANIAGATDAVTPVLTSHGGRAMFEESKSDDYEAVPFTMGFTSGPFQ